jgi:prepilin-type N-terminal cleavage/methylation domain-containing protein
VKARGFTLLECLIGLAVSSFIICASLEFFASAQGHFFRLKEAEEAAQGALAALDKMRIDVLHAGEGLACPAALGVLEPVSETVDGLLLIRAEKSLGLAGSVEEGDVCIPLVDATGIGAGRKICLVDEAKGEVRAVVSVEDGAVFVSPPLVSGYATGKTSVLLLEEISLSLDEARSVLRRGVNLSPAQPLVEETLSAEFGYDRPANLVHIRFRLKAPSQGDRSYELCLFPKNPALAGQG